MIVQGVLLAAAAVATVALLTSKNVREQNTIVVGGMRYQITRFSDNTVLIVRQDGLEFTVDIKTSERHLKRGTSGQLQDAVNQLRDFLFGPPAPDAPTRANA